MSDLELAAYKKSNRTAIEAYQKAKEELTAKEERIRELESQSDEEAKAIATVIAGTDAMIDRDNRIRELEEVLKFYADETLYFSYVNANCRRDGVDHYFTGGNTTIALDKGKRARQALLDRLEKDNPNS